MELDRARLLVNCHLKNENKTLLGIIFGPITVLFNNPDHMFIDHRLRWPFLRIKLGISSLHSWIFITVWLNLQSWVNIIFFIKCGSLFKLFNNHLQKLIRSCLSNLNFLKPKRIHSFLLTYNLYLFKNEFFLL